MDEERRGVRLRKEGLGHFQEERGRERECVRERERESERGQKEMKRVERKGE